MDVARQHMEWQQMRDKCGDRVVKIILERVQVQVTASGQKPTKSHETLSPLKICTKSQEGSLRKKTSRPSSKPSSGLNPGPSNRPQRNKKTNYKHFFDGCNSSEEDDGIKSDVSGFNSESNEDSDCEFQSSPLNKVKRRAKSLKTEHPRTETKVISSLECDLCNQNYKTIVALEKHIIKVHVVDKPFECNICSKSFLTNVQLQHHIRRIHNKHKKNTPVVDKPFKCDICCTSYLTELRLQKHIRRFHEHSKNTPVVHKPFKCDICFEPFSNELWLRKHRQRMHKQNNSQKKINKNNSLTWLQCDLCPYKCTSQSWLEYHIIQVHVEDKPFKCGICIKSFLIKSALKDHVKCSHTNKNFNCKLCPTQSFKDTATLKKHAETVHRGCSDQRDCKTAGDNKLCPVCHTWFLTQAELAEHLKKPKIKSVMKCEICSEPVYTPCRLNQHLQDIHKEISGSESEGIVETLHEKQGPHSEKITKTLPSVKNQVLPKKFSCGVCSAFFSHRSDLECHEKLEKHRCWKCPICTKVFTWKGVLKRHIQAVHSDARPFKCTYKGCSKSYKQMQVLKKHMDMHDIDSYYIECEVCSKKFGTRQTMKQHLVTHTDERPWPCKFCDATFKFSRVANKHMKTCEFMSEDRREKAVKRGRMVIQLAKTWRPKVFILGKWRKLTDEVVKLNETAKAKATPISTSELTSAATSLNGDGTDLKLVKHKVDSKLIKQEADSKFNKQETESKFIKQEVEYFSDNSSDFGNSPYPAVSVAKQEIIPEQEPTYSD